MYKIRILLSIIFCLSIHAENEKKPVSDIFNTKGFDFLKKNKPNNPISTEVNNSSSVKQGPLSGVGLKALVKVSEDNFFAVLSYSGKDYFVRKGSKFQIYSTNSSDLYFILNISIDGVELQSDDLEKSYMVQ